MRAAWTIARKDLRQRARDRSAYLVGILAPLGLSLVFGFVLSPLQDFEFSGKYVVVDLDGGPVAELFVDGVLAGMPGVELVRAATVAGATTLVEGDPNPFVQQEDDADAAFVIPENFSADVQSERPVEIQVIGNRQSPTAAGVAVSTAQGFASELSSVRVAAATVEELAGTAVDRLATGAAILQTPSPATLVDITAETRQLDAVTFYAAGMTVFFLFFSVQFGISSLMRERTDGTLGRLLAAPIGKASVVGGKAISAFLGGVVSSAVLIIATTFLLEADWGPGLAVAVLVVAAVLAAIGIVAAASVFARTTEQAIAFSSAAAVVLGMLGGTFFDLSRGRGLMASLRFVSPHGWFMRGLADASTGELSAVTVPVLAMLVFGVVTGAVALAGLRRRLQP